MQGQCLNLCTISLLLNIPSFHIVHYLQLVRYKLWVTYILPLPMVRYFFLWLNNFDCELIFNSYPSVLIWNPVYFILKYNIRRHFKKYLKNLVIKSGKYSKRGMRIFKGAHKFIEERGEGIPKTERRELHILNRNVEDPTMGICLQTDFSRTSRARNDSRGIFCYSYLSFLCWVQHKIRPLNPYLTLTSILLLLSLKFSKISDPPQVSLHFHKIID